MRFLVLTQYFLPETGAAQLRLAGLSEQLAKLGHDVEIVTAVPNYPQGSIFKEYRGAIYRRESWRNILVHRVLIYPCRGTGIKRLLNYFSFMLMCSAGLARARRADYLFVESPPLFLAIPALIYARVTGARLIFNVADLWPDSVVNFGVMKDGWLIKLARALEKIAYRNSDFVCAVTNGIRNTLVQEKRIPQRKVLFLPNGIDTELFRPLPPDLGLKRSLGLMDKHLLVYAGTHGMAHNIENILQAAQVLRDDTALHFLLIGGGSLKHELMRRARKLQLRNVTFIDPVPPGEIPHYFSIALCGLVSVRQADILASAVSAKTFAIMSCEKPVLFSGPRGAARVIEESKAGLVAEADDPADFAKAAQFLAANPALASEYGKNGRRYVEQRFRWPILVRDWLQQFAGTPTGFYEPAVPARAIVQSH